MQAGAIKEGQVWVDFNGTKRTIEKNSTGTSFIWRGVTDVGTYSTYNDLGQYNSVTRSYNDLKEMIMDVQINQDNIKSEPTKFVPPKPSDKIICNNGEEFICCTLEFLQETIAKFIRSDKPILGYQKYEYDYAWQDWDEHGKASDSNGDYNIREIIPQNVEAADKKEEVKEDARYTVEEVTEAFANALHLVWMGGRKEGIEKVKDYLEKKSNKEYQEYLRLKAIYE